MFIYMNINCMGKKKKNYVRCLLHALLSSGMLHSSMYGDDSKSINDFYSLFCNDFVINEQRANFYDVNRHINVCLNP